jgi:peptide/nickel transport system permease protein
MGTARYLAKRVLLLIVTLVLVSMIIYAATLVIPADPGKVFLGKTASPRQIAEFNHRNGLDQNAISGYITWLGHFIHGNLGESVVSQQSVSSLVIPRLERTMLLAVFAFTIATPISFALGLISGVRSSSKIDFGISVGVLGLAALPEFVIAVIMVWIFAITWPIFPVSSAQVLYGSTSQRLEAYILPAVTLALVVIPHMTRQIRVAVHEVNAAPFMRAGRLRGLASRVLLARHLLPTVGGRVVNVVALNFSELLAGVVVVETVFAFPGIGQQLVQAISSNDVTVMQAVALIIGSAYIIVNFVADAMVVMLNPRLRRSVR